jgi:hypothetical protein
MRDEIKNKILKIINRTILSFLLVGIFIAPSFLFVTNVAVAQGPGMGEGPNLFLPDDEFDDPFGDLYSPENNEGVWDYSDSDGWADAPSSSDIPAERTPYPLPTQERLPDLTETSGMVDDFFDCTIGGILSRAISGVIRDSVAQGIAFVFGSVISTKVQVTNPQQEAKDVGVSVPIGPFSIPLVPSWDSFAYCLVNRTIAYIADSTKQWIRSGFEGNPAFVDDPSAFFQQVADFQFENFMEDIAGELLCEPFKIEVVNRINRSYNNRNNYLGQSGYGRCTIDSNQNFEAFLRGEYFDFDIWLEYTQDPANNPLGAYLMAEGELQRRISAQQNSIMIELDWGDGYFSWKDEETGRTITPGRMIQSELENRLGLDKNRLILADEFDEVITELVDYLIRVSLNEVLGIFR